MSVNSPLGLVLYCYLNMPTINKTYLTVSIWFGSKFDFYNRKLLNLLTYKHFCRFYACIQNRIIHKHVHVDYNPLKGMLVLILPLKLSIVPCAAGPKVEVTSSRTAFANISMTNCFPCFSVRWILKILYTSLISWISLHTKTTKIGTPRIKVISQ